MVELSSELLSRLPKNGETDPIEYYRRPLVGYLFRERINRGLRLLPERRFRHALEVGYGAGAVLAALAQTCEQLSGIDLDADPELVTRLLAQEKTQAALTRGSVYELPYEAGQFDLAASFSVFEHLHEPAKALAEVARVLAPSGLFLLGMPAVSKLMEAGFLAIGFRGIDHHHVTTPQAVASHFAASGFVVEKRATLDLPLPRPFGYTVYTTWLLRKRGATTAAP
jgi:SAM-dependent methyltransferase